MMTSMRRSLILVWPNCLVLVKVISQLESTFGLVSSFCFFWFYSSSSILHVLVFWTLQSSTSGVLFYYFGVKTWSRSLHYYIISLFQIFDSYVAPKYANVGLLNEKNDIYSFGGSVVRIDHTGRDHVDYGRPAQEVRYPSYLILRSN